LARAGEAVDPGSRVSCFGHLGDGTIHFSLSQPTSADKSAFLAPQRLKEMNDASTRFAADQTGAATLLPGDESNVCVVELAESAVESNAWATEGGCEARRRVRRSTCDV
jgi:hypothetical protein